jgi:hypothetical protein
MLGFDLVGALFYVILGSTCVYFFGKPISNSLAMVRRYFYLKPKIDKVERKLLEQQKQSFLQNYTYHSGDIDSIMKDCPKGDEDLWKKFYNDM